jgi:signal transduction histidine kinase
VRHPLTTRSSVVVVIVGIIRGVLLARFLHAGPRTTVIVVTACVVGMLVWIPIVALVEHAWRHAEARQRLVALLVLGLALALLVEPAWLKLVMEGVGGPRVPYLRRVLLRVDVNLLYYACVVAASWASHALMRREATAVAAAELDAELSRAQLYVLTLQLHPHFLFNTLNLISQLAFENLAAARRTLANLRGLLSESVERAERRDVSLDEELRFVSAYLDIQRVRFGAQLETRVEADAGAREVAIPHLVLQPIVENAIVHAVAPRGNAGSISVLAQREGDRVCIRVRDDGPGPSHHRVEGVGLSNTRLRLRQRFGDRFTLQLRRAGHSGAETIIEIPAEMPDVAPAAPPRAVTNELPAAEPTETKRRGIASTTIVSAVVWIALALLFTESQHLAAAMDRSAFVWSDTAWLNLTMAIAWAFLTPVVSRVAERVATAAVPTRMKITAHVAIGSLVTAVQLITWLAALHATELRLFRAAEDVLIDWFLWDIVAYATVVGFATVVLIAEQRRATRLQMAETGRELARARTDAMRLRLQPGILLGAIDAVDRWIANDPQRAEEAITRFGDLLRGLLSEREADRLSLTTELSLLQAYMDVVAGTSRDVDDDASSISFEAQVESSEAYVPALAALSLAAALGGPIDDVECTAGGDVVRIRLWCGAARVDASQVAALDMRLRAWPGGSATVHRDAATDRDVGELILPVTRVDAMHVPQTLTQVAA